MIRPALALLFIITRPALAEITPHLLTELGKGTKFSIIYPGAAQHPDATYLYSRAKGQKKIILGFKTGSPRVSIQKALKALKQDGIYGSWSYCVLNFKDDQIQVGTSGNEFPEFKIRSVTTKGLWTIFELKPKVFSTLECRGFTTVDDFKKRFNFIKIKPKSKKSDLKNTSEEEEQEVSD
jgi:hypothetical protein